MSGNDFAVLRWSLRNRSKLFLELCSGLLSILQGLRLLKRRTILADSFARVLSSNMDLVWLHVASAGELESIWDIAIKLGLEGSRLAVTVTSPSALPQLRRMKQELDGCGARVEYLGLAPWPGEWAKWIRYFRPRLFVTVKYEAWPDLWIALAAVGSKLIVLSGGLRRSLLIVNRVLRLLRQPPPQLYLWTSTVRDLQDLQDWAQRQPRSWSTLVHLAHTGDPRWQRVHRKISERSKRTVELLDHYQKFPRPWVIVANAWKSDVNQIIKWSFEPSGLSWGTLWIVPHHIDGPEYQAVFSIVKQVLDRQGNQKLSLSTTSECQLVKGGLDSAVGRNIIVVDEFGVLAELYPEMDWVWMGGGIDRSLHSLIEPATSGVRIFGGGRGLNRIPEAQELILEKQFQAIRDKKELTDALATSGGSDAYRKRLQERLAASEVVVEKIRAEILV